MSRWRGCGRGGQRRAAGPLPRRPGKGVAARQRARAARARPSVLPSRGRPGGGARSANGGGQGSEGAGQVILGGGDDAAHQDEGVNVPGGFEEGGRHAGGNEGGRIGAALIADRVLARGEDDGRRQAGEVAEQRGAVPVVDVGAVLAVIPAPASLSQHSPAGEFLLRGVSAVTIARAPPALSPPSTRASAARPSSARCDATQRAASSASSTAAGYGASGATR